MTGKLIKYEFRSSIKLMALIWAAIIVSSVLFSLCGNAFQGAVVDGSDPQVAGLFGEIVTFITGFVYFMSIMAMIVITLVLIVMRFYKGLFGSEGYLMNTLPVKPWQLITSKGVVAAVLVIAGVAVSVISVMILAGLSGIADITEAFREISAVMKAEPMLILTAIELLIIVIAGLLKSIYQVYASLAIGQLVNKYRILLALGAYIGINIALSVIAMILMTAAGATGVSDWFINTISVYDIDSVLNVSQAFMAVIFGLTVIQLAAFHVVTERIMSLKLNLQ